VSEIVSEHGGVIRVEDNPPSGTRFVVDVPVSRTPATVEA
jgi:signal transduction histidine kinase